MKANGKQNRKVFKIAESDYSIQTKTVQKQFSFKPITTRKYYAGAHHLTLLINGQPFANQNFQLIKAK